MSYELISERLQIYSCDITDLTSEQIESFLKGWEDGASIESLTVFFDDNANIVLNKESKFFEELRTFIPDYVVSSLDARQETKEAMSPVGLFRQSFEVVDNALKIREDKGIRSRYKLLNKKLNLFSLSKEAAEMEWWDIRLNSYNDALKPDPDYINICYFPETDRLVLVENEDSEACKLLKELAEHYLTLHTKAREEVYETMKSDKGKSIISVLDRAINIRFERYRKEQIRERTRDTREILRYNDISYETYCDIEILYDDQYKKRKDLALVDVFNYAFIQGKRAERAKKKRHQSEVTA